MVHLKTIVSMLGISLFLELFFRWSMLNFRGVHVHLEPETSMFYKVVSIGWWTKSLHGKWWFHNFHPLITACLGFQVYVSILFIHCPIIEFCNPYSPPLPTKNYIWDLISTREGEELLHFWSLHWHYPRLVQAFDEAVKLHTSEAEVLGEKLVFDAYVLGYLKWWVS